MNNKNSDIILIYKKILKLLTLYNSCSKEQKLIEKNLKIFNNFLKEQIK